nr:unnamed protein product [Trypanosoma congolense IL3000]
MFHVRLRYGYILKHLLPYSCSIRYIVSLVRHFFFLVTFNGRTRRHKEGDDHFMSFFEEDLVDEPVRKKRHVEQEQSEQQGTVCDQLSKKWRSGEDGDDADSAPVLSRNASDRIGLRLLQQMHQSSTRGDASCRGSSKNGKMHVVEEYVPLSVGGFMQTTTESLDNLISVRPGDIMCLRCPGDVKTEASNEGNNTREAVGNNPPAAGGMSFVKEKELTEEERLYGRRVTCDMMHEIFEVSRVDSASNSLEAVFLDGTRKKLKIITVRPAGFVESELYKRWKADENSRPVRAVYSTPSAKDTELADDRSKNSQQETTTQARVPKPWWVMPRLIVRVVEETAGDLLGKKFIVKSINRKEGRIRLFSLNATPGDASGGADRTNGTEFHSEAADLAPIDVFGCDALETVVPRVGDQGLLVEGNMRGELVIVTSRGRGESGELNTIRVRSLVSEKEFVVQPHEICKMCI